MTFSYFTHFTRFPGVMLQVANLHQHIMLPSDPLPQTHLTYKGAPLATFAHPPLQGPSRFSWPGWRASRQNARLTVQSKLASRTTGKDIRLRALYSVHCATVLSLWEHFILLVWSASYILLTSEPAHCLTLHCSVCSIVDNCWLLLSRCCTRTRVKLLIAIVPLTW